MAAPPEDSAMAAAGRVAFPPNGVLPEAVASSLLKGYLQVVHTPLGNICESFAGLCPAWLTPNAVTVAAVLFLVPCIYLLSSSSVLLLLLGAGLGVTHDMLDRLDGSIARERKPEGHDPAFGAFLDAQCDKVFHVGFLLAVFATGWPPAAGYVWATLAGLKIVIQTTLFVVRTQDFRALRAGGAPRALKARGEGKLATFANNAGGVQVFMMRATAQLFGVGWISWFQCCFLNLTLLVAVEMALRSLNLKLRARLARD